MTPAFRCTIFWGLLLATVSVLPCLVQRATAQSADFSLALANVVVPPGSIAEVATVLDIEEAVAGWSYGVCHDSAQVQLLSVVSGRALNNPVPGFNFCTLYDEGWTHSVAYDFFPNFPGPLAAGNDYVITISQYSDNGAGATTLNFCNTLGAIPVEVIIVPAATGDAEIPITQSGSISWGAGESFRRGDLNADGSLTLPDVLALLNQLFLGGAPTPCADAADCNDDGVLSLTDAIALLNYLFVGGNALPSPGPMNCGDDATDDSLLCASPCL